jgi:hypothetical protein
MRIPLLFFLLFSISLGTQAQRIFNDTIMVNQPGIILDRLSDRLPDIRPGQRSALEAALYSVMRQVPRNPTKEQKIQLRKRIRKSITEHLDPKQIQRLKALRRQGDRDALDRIIDKSSPNRR